MAVMDQLRDYVKDVVAESKKVSRPTWLELRDSTVVVIVTVLVVMAFIGVVDQLLTMAFKLIFR